MRREWKYRFRRFGCVNEVTEAAAGESTERGVMGSIGSAKGDMTEAEPEELRAAAPTGAVDGVADGVDSPLDGPERVSPVRISCVCEVDMLNLKESENKID